MINDKEEPSFDRKTFIKRLQSTKHWDVIIIGGGATGLGTALDSTLRGYKTLLLEQSDFAKGTSSRSTKLVHGGVRYLAQGNFALVQEALQERGLLLKNAPHLVRRQSFIIPCYSFFSKIKYLIGLKVYDWLAGKYSFGKSKWLNRSALLQSVPEMKEKGLKGGVEYWDGQFDDARLAVNIAQTTAEEGGTVLNYFKVTALTKEDNGRINGVVAYDLEQQKEYHLKAKVVVNATGVFVDEILQMDTPGRKPIVRPSQGVHVVLDRSFFSGKNAMMIPETTDGRVLFAVPWHNHVLVGTTDTPLDHQSLEPIALDKEVTFILKTLCEYLTLKPSRKDVLSVFAGLRPLAAPDKDTNSTKEISRSHKLMVSNSRLITITGGKWTTYRKMAEETVDKAIKVGRLVSELCSTRTKRIHGFTERSSTSSLAIYGSDEEAIRSLVSEMPELGEHVVPGGPYILAEVIWAIRKEMARTVEDVLARRLRILFLDAKVAMEMSVVVAGLMATELGHGKDWQDEQISSFKELASNYLLDASLTKAEDNFILNK